MSSVQSSAPATALRPDNVGRGIAFMLAAVLLFSVMDALIKLASADHPTVQIVFFRNFFAFLPIAFFIVQSGGPAVLATRRPWGHALRAIVGLLSMVCFFKSFGLLPLGDAVALSMSGPIFLTALSVPLLGEQVGIRRWSAVVVGFLGVLVMTRPGSGALQLGALLAIGGAVFYALAMVSVRRLSATERPTAIVFYMALFSAVASGVVLPFFWVEPEPQGWTLLVSIGLLGGVAQMAMTQAFRYAPVALIAPFEYLALVYATGFGYLIWGDVPDVYIISGAAVVVASGLYILHRETVRGRLRPPGAAAHA